MKNPTSIKAIALLLTLIGFLCVAKSQTNNSLTSTIKQALRFSTLGRRLTLRKQDFRYEFFVTKKAFNDIAQNGLFLFTYGTEDHTVAISTNEYPTVGAVYAKYGVRFSNHQLRIIQKDRIIQAPTSRDEEEMNAFYKLSVHSGDVVILTKTE